MKRKDLLIAPLCEAFLIAAAGCTAYLVHRPLLFASLGPTAYEIVETPERASARPYNVIVGHLLGVLCGFTALALTHARRVPAVSISSVPLLRVYAAALAAVLTVTCTLLASAQQPAALSTTLMVATGSMQRPQDGLYIMAGIALVALFGEPLRMWRLRQRAPTALRI